MMLFAYAPALPEIAVAGSALVAVVFGAIFKERSRAFLTYATVAVFLALAVWLLIDPPHFGKAFYGAFVFDELSRFAKVIIAITSAGALLLSVDYMKAMKADRFEYPILMLLSVLGMMMMVSSQDFISLYVGLELQSLPLYVLAAISRDQSRSVEAGLKYFVLGALSSGMLLYGISLVYGASGSLQFDVIAQALAGHGNSTLFMIGIVFVMAGFAFKISAVPFHMWAPDVYEGSPTPVTAFFASAPKVAAMVLILRVLYDAFGTAPHIWFQIILALSLLSMVVGAFAAIGQKNVKRMLAFSSVGHMGYALVGLAAGTVAGIQGVLFYMGVYAITTLGAFACIMCLRNRDHDPQNIEDFAGLGQRDPVIAFILSAILFSLAGIPPLAGFFAKFYVFYAAIQQGLIWLSIIGVVASVVSAFYYLRLVKVMYFDAPVMGHIVMPKMVRFMAVLCGAFVLLLFVYPAPFLEAAMRAAKVLF